MHVSYRIKESGVQRLVNILFRNLHPLPQLKSQGCKDYSKYDSETLTLTPTPISFNPHPRPL